MKFKSIIGSVLLVAASVVFISVAPAQAGECSAEDPCHSYAVVDSNGTVTNLIVCQPSQCGDGEFAGMRVVPQVAANPVTHDTSGTKAYNTDSNVTVTESGGNFTISNNNGVGPVQYLAPEFNASQTQIETSTSLSADVNGNFAKLDATQITSDTTTVESLVYTERQTEEFVELQLRIEALQVILRNWAWFKISLRGWFI